LELLDEEYRIKLRPTLARALVFASGVAPETVDTKEDGVRKKKGKKKKGKKSKKKK